MIRVEQPGLLTSVQDAGRSGWQHLGVGPAGAADALSFTLANLVVGNPPATPALEFTLRGPTLVFEDPARVALCGAPFPADLDGIPMPRGCPVALRAGARLRIGAAPRGCRGYLAVAGGIRVPDVLGSASTDLRGGFGGLQGRALRAGDLLATATGESEWGGRSTPGWRLPWVGPLPEGPREAPLKMIPGPQWDALGEASKRRFLDETFKVDARSDRMGLRLEGPPLTLDTPMERVSAGVASGTVQLPPEGGPILLLADRQTTGGYPRLGEVASVDLPWTAQLRPGDALRFTLCPLEEAQSAWLIQQRRLAFLERLLQREYQGAMRS